jgi:hypothetical protein
LFSLYLNTHSLPVDPAPAQENTRQGSVLIGGDWKQWAAKIIKAEKWEKMSGNGSFRTDVSKLEGMNELLTGIMKHMKEAMKIKHLYLFEQDPRDTHVNIHALRHQERQNPHIDGAQKNVWSVVQFVTGGYVTFFGKYVDVRSRILAILDLNIKFQKKAVELLADDLLDMLQEADTQMVEHVNAKKWVPPGTCLYFDAGGLIHGGLSNKGRCCIDTDSAERITIYFAVSTDPDAAQLKSNTSERPFGFSDRDKGSMIGQINDIMRLILKEKDAIVEDDKKKSRNERALNRWHLRSYEVT